VTGAATFPTASFAVTVTETVPLPSAADVNVAVAKSAGNVNVLFDALNVTVQAAVLPAMEHVEADGLAPLPTSLGAVNVSLTVNTRLYFPSPARQKCEAVMAAIHRAIRCAGIAVRERHWIAGGRARSDSADCERDGRRLPIDPDRCLVGPHGVAQDIGPRDRKLQLALFTGWNDRRQNGRRRDREVASQRRIASRAGRRPGIDPRGSDHQRQRRRLHPLPLSWMVTCTSDRRRLALREPLDLLPGRSDRDSTIHGHSVDRRSPSVDEDLTVGAARSGVVPPPVSVATILNAIGASESAACTDPGTVNV